MGFHPLKIGEVAKSANVEGIFLQMKLTNKDKNALRFLRRAENVIVDQAVEYMIILHLFGAVSFPSLRELCMERISRNRRSAK